jgi:hypothetical protein
MSTTPRNSIRLTLEEFDGSRYINIRHRTGRAGIAIPLDLLRIVIDELRRAEASARAAGLLQP